MRENESEFRQGSVGGWWWVGGGSCEQGGGVGVESGALLFVDPCDG